MNRVYKDLNAAFRPHPATGDVTRVFDYASISQAIKVLLYTFIGERPFSSIDIGSRIRDYLFELNDPSLLNLIREEITTVILKYEPRVVIRDVTIRTVDEYSVAISVIYSFRTVPTKQEEVTVFFQRA